MVSPLLPLPPLQRDKQRKKEGQNVAVKHPVLVPSVANKRTRLLLVLLANVADEIFTEEIIPQPLVDDPCAVLPHVVPVAPVVRLAGFPLTAGQTAGGSISMSCPQHNVAAQGSVPGKVDMTKVDLGAETNVKVGWVPSSQRQTFSSSLSVRPIQK